MQPRVLHFYLLILFGNFPDLLLELSSVVFALFENSLVFHKITLHILDLYITVPDFIEHTLNFGSDPFHTNSASLDATNF